MAATFGQLPANFRFSGALVCTVSVLGQDEGYTEKYNPLPEGVPEVHTCTPAHLHLCTPAPLHTCTPAHLHTFTPAHLNTCTLAHLHTCPRVLQKFAS